MFLNFPKANNFNLHTIKKINEKLDLVEKNKTASVLVTVSAIPKYYSTGLDLK
jgi:enoyl-CoA hydratase/carnithine racemase